MRADEELGRSREVVDLFKNIFLVFTYFVFQVQDNGAYLLVLDDIYNSIYFSIFSLI